MSNRSLSFISFLLFLASCGEDDKGKGSGMSTAEEAPAKEVVESKAVYSPEKCLPEGYIIKDTTRGDLNRDKYPDMILIACLPGEDSLARTVDTNILRPLIILTGQADGSLKQVARNDKVVYCVSCGGMMGDPYVQTVIKNGYFSIEHYGGSSLRWGTTITFKYIPADNKWDLHRIGDMTFSVNDPDGTQKETSQTTKDFGTVHFEQYDIYEDRD